MTTSFAHYHFTGSAFLTVTKHGIDSSRDLVYYGTKGNFENWAVKDAIST